MNAKLVRTLIGLGASDAMIDAIDAAMRGDESPAPAVPAHRIGRRAIVQPRTDQYGTVPPPIVGASVPPVFTRPNGTRVGYRVTIAGARLIPTLVGNNKAVADYIMAHGPSPVDSRQLRAAVLRHKLRSDGTNKAIESAVHSLKNDYTDPIIVAVDKPGAPAPTAGPAADARNAVTLD